MKRLNKIIKNFFIFLIRVYQGLHKTFFVGSCRFHPSCSDYGIEAIKTWGVFRGLALTIWRILRCHPFSAGGFDPVPERKQEKLL